MFPVQFPGSRVIGKPETMTDEQCMSIHATNGVDADGFPFWLTAWKPSYEDMEALNRGEPIFIKTLTNGALPPMAVFTLDPDGDVN